MSRHSSISSYYQPSSRPDSPVPFSSTASSSSSNPQHQQLPQQQQQPPQQPPPPPRNQKADQILQNFYVKVIQIVTLARVTHTDAHAGNTPRKGSLRGVPLVKKTSKWFNLELEDLDIYKEDAKFWRARAITESPPPMLVELLLDTSELSSNQMLVLMDENNRKNRVDITGPSSTAATTPLGQGRTRRNIILESWSLTLSDTPPDPVPEPPVVYKKSIIFFRSLYAYMRLLPAYQLYRRLRKQNHPLKIGFRVSRGHSPEESMFRDSEIGIEVPLIEGEARPMLSEYRFGQVETPIGAFSLKVTYRSNCEFHVDESEAVLSSKFIDMDENYFTPTIVTHSQESVKSMRRPSMETSQPDNRRPLSSTFSPFKSPSLSSSPSPSYLENLPASITSRPSSIHLNRSPSSSSMHRVHSSQQSSGLLAQAQKSGTAMSTNVTGAASSIPSSGANLLSTSAKSNASSTSAPRVTSSFGHRYDSSSRRASSESLPPGRGNRNSTIGSSALFQLTPDDEDVRAFYNMLDTPEPLKMFGKASNSGLGPSFGSGDNSLSASGLRAKSTLDRFQQLKLSNANLSESMSTSQLLAKEQQTNSSLPLAVTTGHSSRRSNLSDVGPGSPTGPSGVSRHSQSFTHQPPTPSPLHTEIPVHPPKSSGRFESQPIQAYSTTRQGATGNTPTKRHSWLGSGSGGSSSSYSGMHHELARKNMGNMAFRHGSLDQGKDILGMEEAMGRMGVAAPDDIAYGSFPEDLHHQHSLYSAPLNTGREKKGDAIDNSPTAGVPFGPDPRPIPSLASGETSTSRPGRLLRLGSGSGFALPRLRTRAADDNESLNEMNSADSSSARGNKGRSRGRGEDDEEDEDDEDARGARSGRERDDKHEANTSINDDDDMLFIMSELSPASTFGQDPSLTAVGSTGVILGGAHDRGMLPLTGAILNLRSQPQSPSFDPHHGNSGSGGTAAGSSSVSPHLRLFGRGGNGNNLGAEHSNNNSRSNSAAHSRVGSSSGSNTNVQNSIENLGLLRRPGSGSGFVDEYNLPSASSTPPPFATVTGAGAFDAMLEGRRMSRGGSDRGIGSGANSGHNSFHSDSRGGRIEGW